ncbi:radial spoke head protein 3 homolog isoform X2 [Nilaparvata lugens]|nr:radial spoke head protein 3 homolog isoform X2 [Nilaparvata lugens]
MDHHHHHHRGGGGVVVGMKHPSDIPSEKNTFKSLGDKVRNQLHHYHHHYHHRCEESDRGGRFRQVVRKAREDIIKASKKDLNSNYKSSLDTEVPVVKNHSYYHKNCFTSNNNYYCPYKKDCNKSGNTSSSEELFADSLNEKLRNLKDGSKIGARHHRGKSTIDERPMFVTTVKTGIFLSPPPELAAILGLQSHTNSSGSTASGGEEVLLYSFSSQPRVLHNKAQRRNARRNVGDEKERLMKEQKKQMDQMQRRAKRDTSLENRRQDTNHVRKPPDQHSQSYGNIMHDKRVIRGSTVVSHPMYSITDSRGVETGAARLAEARRRNMARRKAQTTASRALRLRMSTPPPVEGRKHEDIQTDSYLEQIFDHPRAETVAVQTEHSPDRADTPPFAPLPPGVDASTQIMPGELFDFDLEVKPVLEVLVGKTMEQAIIELLEEEREAEQNERQRRVDEIKEAERAEQKRLEEEEAETKKRLEQVQSPDSKASSENGETQKESASPVLTSQYIQELLPSILDGLKASGYLTEEIKEDVEDNFMAWLMSEVTQEMKRVVENRDLLSDIVKEILDTRAELHRAMGQKETKKRKPKSFKTLSVEGTDNDETLSDAADDDADDNEQPTKNPLPDL